MSTPRDEGFFMPAEWRQHSRCLMAWPCREALWGERLEAARDAYCEVAEAISHFEPVTLLTPPAELASASMRTGGAVSTLPLEIDDSWMRDNGPTFLTDAEGNLAGVDWVFNAWGRKYEDFDRDDAVPAKLLERAKLPRFRAPLVMEGGSFHVDGEGTLITTESCLLNPNRNPDLSKEEIEAHLKAYLGVTKIIWLFGDPLEVGTDGHVDNLACFVKPGTVLALAPAKDSVANREALEENLKRLRAAEDAAGRKLEVIEVPQPQRIHEDYYGEPFHGSYVNFYLANGGLVMPSFEDPNDGTARGIVQAAFPDRETVVVPGSDVVYGGGCIHCITQQQPAAPADSPN
ncbi:MAG: agmatine deiminase family protein [Rhodospirillales bacterium]